MLTLVDALSKPPTAKADTAFFFDTDWLYRLLPLLTGFGSPASIMKAGEPASIEGETEMIAFFALACIILIMPKLHYALAYMTHVICATLGAIFGFQLWHWLLGSEYVTVSILFVSIGMVLGASVVRLLADLFDEGACSQDMRVAQLCKTSKLALTAAPIALTSGVSAARLFYPGFETATAADITNAIVLFVIIASIIGFATLRAMKAEMR